MSLGVLGDLAREKLPENRKSKITIDLDGHFKYITPTFGSSTGETRIPSFQF
jgi:hypothetical protein